MNHSKSEYVTIQYFSCELLLIYVSNNSISNINIQEQFENKVLKSIVLPCIRMTVLLKLVYLTSCPSL